MADDVHASALVLLQFMERNAAHQPSSRFVVEFRLAEEPEYYSLVREAIDFTKAEVISQIEVGRIRKVDGQLLLPSDCLGGMRWLEIGDVRKTYPAGE